MQEELPNVREHEETLAREKAEREARIEREQVEWVFSLTGGELNDKPWRPFTERDLSGDPETFRYSYNGAPEYDEDHRDESDYVTVVSDCMCGEEPENLYEKGARYECVVVFSSSGECECPFVDVGCDAGELDNVRPCPYCEAQDGEDHGCIYLGDGWCETVYQRIATCETCGVDLTDDDAADCMTLCDVHAPHEWRVWDGSLADMKAYRGEDETEARRVYDAAVARGDDHYIALSRDGVDVAEVNPEG